MNTSAAARLETLTASRAIMHGFRATRVAPGTYRLPGKWGRGGAKALHATVCKACTERGVMFPSWGLESELIQPRGCEVYPSRVGVLTLYF